ncbi:MAG: glycosyltransferase, partial [Coriobacteriia bacterium]|nr:glycosyltransferase [Coriobacteriia bacterium]
YEIIVVDDGSSDDTGEIAASKAPAMPVTVLRNEPNQGLGRTIRRGLRAAADRSTGRDDVIVTLDADLTQDPGYVPSMLARIDEGFDVVIASRYRKGSGVEGLSAFRTMLSYFASGLITLVRPIRGVRDYSCGFRVYRAETIREGFGRDDDDFVSESGFACMVEIAERLRGHANFSEVPFVLRYDAKRKESAIRILPTIGAYFRVLAKVAASQKKVVPVATLVVAFTGISIGAIAQLLLRMGVMGYSGETITRTLIAAFQEPLVIGGLVLYAVSSALWLGVLSRMDLSVAYPLGASGYVLVVMLAAFSGESVPGARWFGVLLIVMGVMLIGWLGVAPAKEATS